MTGLETTLRRAARRDLTQRAIVRAGRGVAGGCGLAVGVLLLDRGLGLGLPPVVYAVLAGAGLLAGALAALFSSGDRFPIAVRLDRTFGLHDRLATAQAIDARPARSDAGFRDLVRRDAEHVAGRIDVARATPIRLTPAWGGAAALAIALALGVLFLPPGPWRTAAAVRAPVAPAQVAANRAEVAESIEEAVAQLEQNAVLDDAGREDLDALHALADQLGAPITEDDEAATGATPPDGDPVGRARDESATRLQELADRLSDEADRDARAAEALTERFRDLESARAAGRKDAPLHTDELIDALQRGEFGEAGNLLDELAARSEALDEAERQRAVEALREAARKIGELGDAAPPGDPVARERLAQTLREQGVDEDTIEDLLDRTTATPPPDADAAGSPPDDVKETLRREDLDEDVADDLAREIESLRKEDTVDEQVRDDARRIADALDEAADRVEKPDASPREPAAPPATPDERQTTDAEQTHSESPGNDQQQPGAEQTPRESPDGQKQPGAKQTPRKVVPDGQKQPGAERTPREVPDGQKQPGAKQTPRESPDGQKSPGAEQTPRETPDGQKRPGAEQTPRESPDGQKRPGAQQTPRESPDGQQQPGAERVPRESPDGEKEPGAEQMPRETPDGQRQPGAKQTPRESPDGQKQPGAKQTPREVPDGQKQPGAEQMPREIPDGEQKQPGAEQTPRELPGEQKQPGAKPGTGTQSDPRVGADEPRPGDALRDIERRRSAARRNRDAAERARGAARRLAENMTDEERRRWAERWQRDAGVDSGDHRAAKPPADSVVGTERGEDVPLTGDDVPGRHLTDWLDDEMPTTLDETSPVKAAGRLRSARRAAERAVNESSVPPRYHRLIKRYFDRLGREAAGKTREAPPADAPDPEAGKTP